MSYRMLLLGWMIGAVLFYLLDEISNLVSTASAVEQNIPSIKAVHLSWLFLTSVKPVVSRSTEDSVTTSRCLPDEG